MSVGLVLCRRFVGSSVLPSGKLRCSCGTVNFRLLGTLRSGLLLHIEQQQFNSNFCICRLLFARFVSSLNSSFFLFELLFNFSWFWHSCTVPSRQLPATSHSKCMFSLRSRLLSECLCPNRLHSLSCWQCLQIEFYTSDSVWFKLFRLVSSDVCCCRQ